MRHIEDVEKDGCFFGLALSAKMNKNSMTCPVWLTTPELILFFRILTPANGPDNAIGLQCRNLFLAEAKNLRQNIVRVLAVRRRRAGNPCGGATVLDGGPRQLDLANSVVLNGLHHLPRLRL